MRQEAKQGLKKMEAMGQMGNADEATLPDDMPFDMDDLEMEDGEESNVNFNQGGVVSMAEGELHLPENTGKCNRFRCKTYNSTKNNCTTKTFKYKTARCSN